MDRIEISNGYTAEGFLFRVWKDDKFSWTYGYDATTAVTNARTRVPRVFMAGRARTLQEALNRISRWSQRSVAVAR